MGSIQQAIWNLKEFIWTLDIENVYLAMMIAQTVTAVLLGITIYRLSRVVSVTNTYEKIRLGSRRKIMTWLMDGNGVETNYDRINTKLVKKGYTFYFNNMEPSKYIAIKAICTVAGMLVGLTSLNVIGALIGAVIGLYAIDIYEEYKNNQDNKEIINDVRLILGAIRVQTIAGIYIIDCLQECYYDVKNPRLKQALLDFTGDVKAKKDIGESIDVMNSKFSNKFIESLCSAIKQLMQSGKSANMVDYIQKQVLAVQKEMNVKEEGKILADTLTVAVAVFLTILIYVFSSIMPMLTVDIM